MRSHLPILLLLLVVAFVGAFTWWLLGEEQKRPAYDEPRETAVANSDTSDRAAPDVAARSEPERPAAAPPKGEEAAATPDGQPRRTAGESKETTPVVRQDEILLSGTVIVTDSAGVEHAAESGSFHFVCWSGGRGSHVEVTVTAGAYRAAVPLGRAIEAGGMRLRDRPAIVETAKCATPESGTLHLRARWSEPVTLHVLSQLTGQHLGGVIIVERGWSGTHPGLALPDARDAPFDRLTRSKVVLRDAQSPIEYPEGEGVEDLWVGATGFAWAEISLDTAAGGTRTVELRPAGTLRLTVEPPSTGGILCVFAGDEASPVLSVPFQLTSLASRPYEPIELTGLPPGSYRAAGHIGEWYDTPHVLGSTSFTLDAGVATEARLSLELPPELPAAVRVSGTLALGAGWDTKRPRVTLESIELPAGAERVSYHDAAVAGTGDPTFFHWTAGDLVPGRYQARVSPGEVGIPFDVPPGSPVSVPLEVASPAELLLRVTDAATGQLLPEATVHWNIARPEGVSGGSVENARFSRDRGGWPIEVPAGRRVHLSVSADGYGSHSESRTLEAGGGTTTAEVPLTRATLLVVEFHEGDTPVPVDFGSYVSLHATHVDSQGTASPRSWSREGARFELDQPGRYEVSADDNPAFAPIAPQIVDCPEGETTRIRVQLVRR